MDDVLTDAIKGIKLSETRRQCANLTESRLADEELVMCKVFSSWVA